MKARTINRFMARRLPYQFAAAVSVALAITFAAGVSSVAAYPGPGTEAAPGNGSEPVQVTPFEYFPARYQNQATEAEPLPPQF